MRATARKTMLALAGTALALGTMAGCGGSGGGGDSGSSAPDNASTEEFCDAFNSLFTEVMAKAGSGDMSQAIPAIKEWAENMQDVGTPDDMPDDAREGFEVFVDAAADIDEDAKLEDLQNLGDDLSEVRPGGRGRVRRVGDRDLPDRAPGHRRPALGDRLGPADRHPDRAAERAGVADERPADRPERARVDDERADRRRG